MPQMSGRYLKARNVGEENCRAIRRACDDEGAVTGLL
jgi:hypothetical protein